MSEKTFHFDDGPDAFDRLKADAKARSQRKADEGSLQARIRAMKSRVDVITGSAEQVELLQEQGKVELKPVDAAEIRNELVVKNDQMEAAVAKYFSVSEGSVQEISSLFDVLRSQPVSQLPSFVPPKEWAVLVEPQQIREGFQVKYMTPDELSRAFKVSFRDGTDCWMVQRDDGSLQELGWILREGASDESAHEPSSVTFRPGMSSASLTPFLGQAVDSHRFYAQIEVWLTKRFAGYHRFDHDVSLLEMGVPGVSGPVIRVIAYPGTDREKTHYFSAAAVVQALSV